MFNVSLFWRIAGYITTQLRRSNGRLIMFPVRQTRLNRRGLWKKERGISSTLVRLKMRRIK